MVALASAFVRLRPQPDRGEFVKAGQEMGDATGKAMGKGIKGGVDAGLEAARKRAADTGGAAGKAWGDGFHRDSQGKIRDAQGKFVQSSIASGTEAGKGYAGGFTKGTSGIGASLKSNLKLAAGAFIPLGIAGAVGEIAKIGIQYEDNLNIFQSVTKATGAEMGKVAAKARQLGSDVNLPGVSAAGAAAAMTELGKAGFTVQQSMDAAAGTLQLARIASLSEADAATITANAVNAFGIKASDTTFVVDELAAAANSSSIEISDVSLAFKQAAAVFSGFQGPAVGSKEAVTELNTAIAILGNNGIKGSDAGTSLKQALLQLTGPTQAAKDQMKELALNAQGANITLEQQNAVLHGSKSVREANLAAILKANPAMKNQGDIAFDASGKMRGLRDILKLTADGTKGMTQQQRAYAITQIFGADASRSIIALLKGGIPVYDAQRKAVLQSGAAADVAAAKNKGLGGAIDNVKSQLENAAISIYNVVKGPLTTALNGLAAALPGVFSAIGKVFGFLADHKGTVLGVAYAVGILTLAIKAQAAAEAIATAGGIIKFLISFAKATRVAAAGQAVFNIALTANPIGIVVVAIGALVAAFVIAYKNSATFRNIVQGALNGVKVAAIAVADFFTKTFWPGVVRVFNAVKGAVVSFYQNGVRPAFLAVVGFLKSYVFPIFTFLYTRVVQPVFAAISKVVQVWWLGVRIVFAALRLYLTNVVFPIFRFLYNNVVSPVFKAVSKAVQIAWLAIRIVLTLLKNYLVNIVFPVIRFLYNNVVKPIFQAVALQVSTVWNRVLKPIFGLIRTVFQATGKGLAVVYNTIIRPLFDKFGQIIQTRVAPAFTKGVELIKKAWEKIRDAARTPIAFVVNHVINPFIGGLNNAAKIVGVKGNVSKIQGFAQGGQTPVGKAAGGKISGAGGTTDNRQAMIPGVGAVQLMGGEFVVNRQDTGKALPILRWINDGMKGGLGKVANYIGRPLTDYPGDGSEGWAFKDGGLIGWTKDIWNSLSDPVGLIKKPFKSALGKIPGGGQIKDFLLGAANRLLDGSVKYLSAGFGGSNGYTGSTAGRVGLAQQFIKAQNGKPYVWASAGPGGYDCSGIVSAAWNILNGRDQFQHTFSTGSLPGGFFRPGFTTSSPLLAGWSHPGQSPASASVGHMAGQIAGMPFESRGSQGVIVGNQARRVSQFANHGHFADGGQLPKVQLFDKGGYWPTGTLGANMSGRTEYVNPPGQGSGGGDVTNNFNFYGPVASKQGAQDMVLGAYKQLVKENKIPDPRRQTRGR